MNRRQSGKQLTKRRSPVVVGLSWTAGFVSLGLVYLSGKLLAADLAAFRSCDANSSGLQIASCGKHGINFSDMVLITFFGLSIALVMSLFTASWRMSRRVAV